MKHLAKTRGTLSGPRRRGLGWRLGLIGMGVLAASTGAYSVWGRGSGSARAGSTTHIVERRSFPLTLEEKGTLKAAKSTNIICDIEGEAKILKLVPEGTTVKEGDFLIEFAADKIEEQLRSERANENESKNSLIRSQTEYETHQHESSKKILAAERDLEQKRLDLEKYNKADWPQQLADAELAVANAEDEHKRTSEQLEASKRLREKKFISEPELLEHQIDYRKAVAELEKATLAILSLKAYTHPKDLDAKESAVKDAEGELSFVKKQADDTTQAKLADIEAKKLALDLVQQKIARLEGEKTKTLITAPGPGIVVYGDSDNPWMRENIGEGKQVWKGTVVLQLPDMTRMNVTARIHESKADQVTVGVAAEVKAESSDEVFRGTVVKIGALPATNEHRWLNPEVKEYETEIQLEGENLPLRPGGTAKVQIFVGQVADVIAVPIQSVFSRGRRSFVFRETTSGVEPVEVTTGRASSQYVEVAEGVKAGEKIRLAVDESLMAKLPEVSREENGPRHKGPPQAVAKKEQKSDSPPPGNVVIADPKPESEALPDKKEVAAPAEEPATTSIPDEKSEPSSVGASTTETIAADTQGS